MEFFNKIGHFRSSELPENRHANDRLQSTAVIARRPFEGAHSPKQSPTVVQRWSASDAGRTSAVRAAELELPTHPGRSLVETPRPEADTQRRIRTHDPLVRRRSRASPDARPVAQGSAPVRLLKSYYGASPRVTFARVARSRSCRERRRRGTARLSRPALLHWTRFCWVGGGGSGTPPGPVANVSGEIASCWPTPGLPQSHTPPANAARRRVHCAGVKTAGA
jgi:hypothetical protein